MTELKQRAEEEAIQLELIAQAVEIDKQGEVQNLTVMVEYFRNATAKSVDEFMNRLKLDLNLLTDGQDNKNCCYVEGVCQRNDPRD